MNNADEPLVSVLMTAYNREKYIAEAIESVLVSTYTNFELLICDDCSADSTVAIARRYMQQDERVRVYVNETNLQQFPNRNKATLLATGEFIFFVDSDDTILPDAIERLVATMNSFPDSSFGMYYPEKCAPFQLQSKEAIHKHFFEKPFLGIGPGGTILRRSFLLSINGYPDKYAAAGDMYFNLKAVCHSSIVLMPFDFLNYRVHGDQELNTPFSYMYNTYLYLMDALAELPLMLTDKEIQWLKKKCKRRFLTNLVKFYLRTHDTHKVRELVRKTNFGFKDTFEAIFH